MRFLSVFFILFCSTYAYADYETTYYYTKEGIDSCMADYAISVNSNGVIIGKAIVLELIQLRPKCDYCYELKVKEALFHPYSGDLVYLGITYFRFPYGERIPEKRVTLINKNTLYYDVFDCWPVSCY